jgi:hypothetical protein
MKVVISRGFIWVFGLLVACGQDPVVGVLAAMAASD